MTPPVATPPRTPLPLRTLRAFVLLAAALVTYAALVLPLSLRAPTPPMEPGDVAPRDMQAPRTMEYVSQVRTEEAQNAAEKAVLPVYTPPDPTIARKQIDKLNAVLQTINIVRADSTSTLSQKAAALSLRSDTGLRADTILQIVSLPDTRWSVVEQEARRVLEQVMRTRGSETERWTLTGAGVAQVVVVVRDLRGGTAWAVRDVVVGQ